MALYDGFFDAYEDEETGEYDRVYDSEEFVQYFGQIIGSGVCVYENPDSFKVQFSGGNAVVSPGYLFIRGYWLKNDADYTVQLTGSGVQAVVAHLNLTKKMIEIEAQSKAQSYPDSLVLAYVDTAAGTVQDTRPDTDICGIIDAAGSVSNKIIWATDYINNEVKAKLAQAEADINAQSVELDKRIEQVSKAIEQIVSPPIGTIKFSAAQTPENGWLRCDGSFISEASYPALVQALGKINPGIQSFSEIAGGDVARDISNGVLYNGRFWVFSNSAKKLYGISVSNQTIKEINISGTSELSTTAASTYPIFLSIIGSAIFLAQRFGTNTYENIALYANYSFSENLSSVSMSKLSIQSHYENIPNPPYYPTGMYVIKASDGYFYMAAAYAAVRYLHATDQGWSKILYCKWTSSDSETTPASEIIDGQGNGGSYISLYSDKYMFMAKSLLGFNRKNENEMVWFSFPSMSSSSDHARPIGGGELMSAKNATYSLGVKASDYNNRIYRDIDIITLSIVGESDFMVKYSVQSGLFTVKFIQAFNSSLNMRYVEKTVPLSAITSRAKAFTDACLYIPDSALWLFFVGTGIVFTRDLSDTARYGFLDTQNMLGVISKFGYIEYDSTNDTIIVMGQDTSNTVKIGVLKLYGTEDYVSNGVFLPTLSESGIPAYIKAKETQG